MKKLKLCNVHKLAFANEGEGRKTIHIPFGTWAYDDRIDQTLDREHAEKIAADLAGKIAAGEPGIPVYQGHPDVPEYASKYPDKGALGWVKKILVNESGMDLEVEWDRDPGKGFGWFSPFWTGDDPGPGATGKRNVIVDGLTSVGLVNNPNIREFRLANEAQPEERKTMKPYQLPQRIIDLANEYDESKHPRAEDGRWTSGVGGGGATVKKVDPKTTPGYKQEQERNRKLDDMVAKSRARTDKFFGARTKALQMLSSGALGTGSRANVLSGINGKLQETRAAIKYHPAAGTVPYESEARKMAIETRRGTHAAAILHGFKYNRSTHQYE